MSEYLFNTRRDKMVSYQVEQNVKQYRINLHLSKYNGTIFCCNGKNELITDTTSNPSNIMDLDEKEFSYYIYGAQNINYMFCYIPNIGLGHFIYNVRVVEIYEYLKQHEIINKYIRGGLIMQPPYE